MEKNFIPALHFKSLNNLFDRFLKVSMNEEYIKNELIYFSKLNNNYTILDFGCGTGTLIKMILDKIPELNIIGLDIDQNILNIANQKLKLHNPQLIKYNGTNIPFNDNYFDTVLTSLAIHHIYTENKIPIFSEIRRVIKKGGKFYILDFVKPKDMYSKFVTSILKMIEPIHDNIEGKIPGMLIESGFTDISENGYFKTTFGPLTIYCGTN
jgi:ubiquinone/menaquinone biosynthesis C-methylase UbiE